MLGDTERKLRLPLYEEEHAAEFSAPVPGASVLLQACGPSIFRFVK
jgi:hypothetical protein